MAEATWNPTTAGARASVHLDEAVCERVRGEYLEMPGLRLTLVQASRLFNLEVTHCSQVLEELVKDGVLRTNGREFLARNTGRGCS